MLFNSFDYLIFLPTVVALFFLIPQRLRWVFLLGASYYFYACWKVEYVFLLGFSTLVNFYAGLQIGNSDDPRRKKRFLLLSLVTSLGVLFFFKYLTFVNESLRDLFNTFNVAYGVPAFQILLPIGISFYTFQTLSYTIDVYRGKLKPEKHLGIFALYVSFFPQLVAGPIERSTNLLPQFYQKKTFDLNQFRDGFLIILWGFFKKVVIADRLAIYVNAVYNNPSEYYGMPVLVATIFFAFQIYCDFSGYTDIAIGTARMMGYKLMDNFRRPFAARTVAEFWQRWHISLTKWIMDYLYFPMARKAKSKWHGYFVTFFVFVVIGLWHGAAWNFALFGALVGLVLVIGELTKPLRRKVTDTLFPKNVPVLAKLHRLVQTVIVFQVFVLGCVLFRSTSVANIGVVLQHMLQKFELSISAMMIEAMPAYEFTLAIIAIVIMETVQWLNERKPGWALYSPKPAWQRWPALYALIFGILMFGEFNLVPFIYFQF